MDHSYGKVYQLKSKIVSTIPKLLNIISCSKIQNPGLRMRTVDAVLKCSDVILVENATYQVIHLRYLGEFCTSTW